ncbi:TonB-dependent receptor [Alteromonas sp. BL110]|uniref:TonB-dependent receptor n=1 Tax=Alteromonas sp. BL110 TaxID=1714845 RepID=UPI000E51A47A|nr:TonB-dependent receptor [Alteromonas sp. BL110]AXT40668.1 TonB-dependent receptor [Alteromonas sp. BL110]RKM79904.1 TonB-dependent receptor [Alteromonas sp. BL110]
MKIKTAYSSLTLACITALGLTVASPVSASDGIIIGSVKDAAKARSYAGAQIKIIELGLSTEAGRDGTFRFPSIPEGTYTLEVSYLGEQTITQDIKVTDNGIARAAVELGNGDTIDEILVRGQRSGQASAINQQRASDRISSIISADAIGQFPDQNAAESLQRLPGLSIERDQGEGRFVGIRGIDPNLNNVTINGLNIPSPESGVRSVALDVIPSELIQTLEVSKSVTPDMDGDAIGGSVAVKSVSAFDKARDTASVTVQASQNDLRDQISPKLSGTFTKKLSSKWGVAGAVSYFDRDFGSDNVESNGDDELEQRHYTITRERLGSALNIDFRPDFNNQYFLRTLYSEFSDDEFRQGNIFTFDSEDSEIERESKDRFESQSIFTVALGGEHQLKTWAANWQLGYAKSDEDEPDALYYVFKTENDSIDADLNTIRPTVSQNADAMDLSTYEVDEISFEDNYTKDTETSIKFDVARPLNLGGYIGELKMGSKYRSREKDRDSSIAIFDGDFDEVDASQFGAASPGYSLDDFGPGLDRGEMRSYFNDNRGSLELDSLNSEVESRGATYVNEEDIFAAYIMGSVDIDKLHLVAGVRYERTDFSTSGMRVELVENEETDVEEVVNTPWEAERDYSHWLPSLNARYTFSDKLQLRAAYTQTISRPKFEDVAAFQIIESKTEEDDGAFVTERAAEVGNPELQPYEAQNLDLSIEYYPGDIGVMSAGLFYKNIDNFVVYADVAGTTGWEGFEEVVQPINGDSANLTGLELSWVKAFNNGFIVSANATFTDSEATTFLDGEKFETHLPNQSDRIGNLTIGYEANDFSVRLATTYKSDNFEEIDGDMLRFEDDHIQVDFMARYYINNSLQVYFNGINLGDEPFYNYFDTRSQNAQYEEYGRTFELGFTWQLN